METLKIPKEHQEKFEFYVGLPPELKERLIAEIRQSEIGLTSVSLIEVLSDKLLLSKERLTDVVTILMSLLNAKEGLTLTDEDFLSVLTHTFEQMENLQFPVKKMVEDIGELLLVKGENATLNEKIIGIITDNQKNFLDITFNNDMRPLFLDTNNQLTGLMMLHKLKIVYYENGETKEIHFSLDSNDLHQIKEKIGIAEKQAESLKSLINQSFIEII